MKEKIQPGNESWRIFCAIELPLTVRELALRHIATLKRSLPDVRASWSRDSNLHLTLKFLGETSLPSVANFSSAVTRAVNGRQPFSIRLAGTGVFPNPSKAQVLWLGINEVSQELGKLHTRLEEEAALVGFEKDNRPFHPHLTIARIRNPQFARPLAATHLQLEFPPAEIAVSELLVIRSELSSAGSKYTVVSRHSLDSLDLDA